MFRSWMNICLVAAISLSLGVIWPDSSLAAQAPQLELLGNIRAGLRVPTRVAVDSSGNLFVADARLQQIFKFDRFGRQLLVVDQEQISGAGLAVSPAGDRIYASAVDRVVIFNGAGERLGYLGQGAGEFVAAGSIERDRDGNIYVADLNRRHVKIFNPDGSSPGILNNISFIANSSLGIHPVTEDIYVSDSVVHSGGGLAPMISIFARSFTPKQQLLASNGFGPEPLLFFGGIAFDDQGRLYVSDIEGKSIRILDSAAGWLSTFDRNGELSRPGAMVYDPVTSRLFVVQADQQIDIYGVDGGQSPAQVNSAPAAPVPVAPIGGSEVVTQRPLLLFNNAVDENELDEHSYTVKVFDAGQNLVTSLTATEQPGTTSVVLDVDLQENSLYQWQVQAFDGQAASDWSELQSFYVNADQEAPSIPLLLAPLAADVVTTDDLLEWQAATDADPFDTLSYQVEVSAAAGFNEILFTDKLVATQRLLADWSDLLEPGKSYFWRVTAIDNHGLESLSTADGSFTYQASLLSVTANMPGARVYLGGHQGYAGQYIGEAPVSLRDLPEGAYQLVVERAGFEPFLQPVEIQIAHQSEVYAQLVPAQVPNALTFNPLKVAGRTVKTGSLVAPLVVDLDLDGIEDLLLTHADGSIHYHPGILTKTRDLDAGSTEVRKVLFQPETLLSLPQLAGGTPCLVDWNNDYQQDLLIGTADGAVWLFHNQGDFNFSDQAVMLAAVGSSAVPAVGDIDADGDKDLVVGSGNGELLLFRNQGTDSEPHLAEPQLLVTFVEAAAPTFADWNGDGRRELLIAAEGQIYHLNYTAGVPIKMAMLKFKGAPVARLFALDLDGVRGKDLVAGTTDGQLLWARSKNKGKNFVADFYPAVESKLQQLKNVLTEEDATYLPLLERMFTLLGKQRMGRLLKVAEDLQAKLPADAAATEIARELAGILK